MIISEKKKICISEKEVCEIIYENKGFCITILSSHECMTQVFFYGKKKKDKEKEGKTQIAMNGDIYI